MSYVPENGWKCPCCGHEHSKAHYSLPDQIDYTKKPSEEGRILFNRRKKDDSLDPYTEIRKGLPDSGSSLDSQGFQRPLFCPHCGWEDTWVILSKSTNLIDEFLGSLDKKRYSKEDILKRFTEFLKNKGRLRL